MCVSGFEFLPRPYPYAREPFRLGSGEVVGYEGRYFSVPAFGLLLDKRLFTPAVSHPVTTPIRLYINKDAGLVQPIEPSLDASGYQVATPHYADYILDMRDLLDDVLDLHAADSQYSSDEFFRAHMQRNRAEYDLENSSVSGLTDLQYVHPNPANTVPVAPSSTLTPSNQIELGAQQFQDIDMDEIMWQPFTRPKAPATGQNGIPLQPIFPAALPGGDLPEFSDLDKDRFGKLGYDVSSSGGVLITGDALVEGTSIKLLTGSGEIGANEGDFVQAVEWAQFPCQNELNRYYVTQNGGCINASGRQAIYDIPGGLSDDQVYLLDVSSQGSSGLLIQNYPANYHATSGIDSNGLAHDGVHVVDRLLYNLNEINANSLAVGRSLINGKKIFGHFGGSETNSKGGNVNGTLKYANGDTVYATRGVITPIAGGGNSEVSWATINKLLSPISWGSVFTSSLQPRTGLFGSPPSTTWSVGDIMAAEDGVCWFKLYRQWGYMDRMVFPGSDRAGGGGAQEGVVTYETHVYREGTDPITGAFTWIELDPPESPIITTQTVKYFADTYDIGNIMSLFFYRKLNRGFVHANSQTYIQWSEILGNGTQPLPRYNKLAPISSASRSTKKSPATSSSVSTAVVGFFPSWKIRLYATTNNQIDIPDKMAITPAASVEITFAPDMPFTPANVDTYGPVVWDPDSGLNYLYFSLRNSGGFYFAKMDTSFQIIHVNRVTSTDVILSGRPAILSL